MNKEIKYIEPKTFEDLYAWFLQNSQEKQEVFVKISRKKPENCEGILSYYNAVNVALCFGWIDSVLRNIDGILVQRFSPRRKNSHWTELNISRCKELHKKGLMQPQGIKACPVKLE